MKPSVVFGVILAISGLLYEAPADAQICYTCSAENQCDGDATVGFPNCLTMPDGCLVSGGQCQIIPAFYREKGRTEAVLVHLKSCEAADDFSSVTIKMERDRQKS